MLFEEIEENLQEQKQPRSQGNRCKTPKNRTLLEKRQH